MKKIKFKTEYNLYIFSILLILTYLRIPFVIFIFFIPLFSYIKNSKQLNFKLITIIISITSLINFISFHPYGIKLLIIITFANLLFFIPFIYISKILINHKHCTLSITGLYFILFYIYKFLPFNNFWLNLSGILHTFPTSIQYIGSYGTTFLLILFNISLFKFIENLNNLKKQKKQKKIQINYNTIFLIILTLNFFIFTLNTQPSTSEQQNTLKVAGIQGNINQDWYTRYKNSTENYKKYINLSKQAIKQNNPQIIIWPEYTFTHPIEFDLPLLAKLKQFSNKNNITLITGSILLKNKTSNNSKRYNTLYIFENNTYKTYNAYEPVTIFDKKVEKTKHNNKTILKNTSIGFAICYEENFPYIFTKQIKQNNASLFFIVGNQYYISNKQGLKLTSVNSNLRAAENNRYILRLETAGYSTIINNNGKNIKSIPIKEEKILYYEIPLINQKTFYSIHRIKINICILIISILFLSINLKQQKHSNKNKQRTKINHCP